MKHLSLLSSAVICSVAVSAIAGPLDVPKAPHPVLSYEVEGELQPHHQLTAPVMPEKAVVEPLPEPEIPYFAIESGEISIGEGPSLLGYQGLRDPKVYGFRDSVWQYMTQAEATKLLANLPEDISLSRLKERVVTLLLLKSNPPQEADDTWMTIRLAVLNRLGEGAHAEKMLESIPPTLRGEMNPLALFRFFLRSGREKPACEAVRGADVDTAMSEAQWRQVELFCHGAMGEFSEVELAMALAEESQSQYPQWLVQLVEKFQYPDVKIPAADEVDSELGRLMVQASTDKPLPLDDADGVDYPKKPSYAIKAISKLIRQDRLDEAPVWLAMLDTRTVESASSYVAHELVRFLQKEGGRAQSVAAMTLPPFAGLSEASGAEIDLLARFYQVMQEFDYHLPALTIEWMAQHSPSRPQSIMGDDYSNLGVFAKEGNKAGYLLYLASIMENEPLKSISAEAASSIFFDLKRLGEPMLAKQLAAQVVIQDFE